jgi:hypothetical protein
MSDGRDTILTGLLQGSIMQGKEFEWDDSKAEANYAKHGVGFEIACDVFRDPFAIEQMDDRFDYGEDRYTIIGMASGRLIFVVSP